MPQETLTYDKQPCTAQVCGLMVSTPVMRVITWITTHLPTLNDGRLSWPGWLTHSGHFTHELVTREPQIRRRSGKVSQVPKY